MWKRLIFAIMMGVAVGAIAVAMLNWRDAPSTGTFTPVPASVVPVEAAPGQAGSGAERSPSPIEVVPEQGGTQPAVSTEFAVQMDVRQGLEEGLDGSPSGSVATGVAPKDGSGSAPQVTDPAVVGGPEPAEAAFEVVGAADGAGFEDTEGSAPDMAVTRVAGKGERSGADPSQAEGGNAFTRDREPPSGEEEAPAAPEPVPAGSGSVYTWQDGDRTRQVRLQVDLAVVEDASGVAEGDIVTASGGRSIINVAGATATADDETEPVFRSESGNLMSLPGGVVVILDPAWSRSDVQAFFAGNSISLDRVSDLGELPNAFMVETEPGFPSLELANALAGQVGVVVSSPNWWTQAVTK